MRAAATSPAVDAQPSPEAASAIGGAELAAALCDRYGGAVEVTALTPLPGGACQDNARVDLRIEGGRLHGVRRLVLRADALRSLPGSLRRADEARVIAAAVDAGVRTPAVRLQLDDRPRPGASALLLDFCEGVALGREVVASPALAAARQRLPEALAAELAHIHSVRPERCPDLFEGDAVPRPDVIAHDGAAAARAGSSAAAPTHEPEAYGQERTAAGAAFERDGPGDALAALTAQLAAMVEPHPALHRVLAWLQRAVPRHSDLVLVHGDFRVGNFLVSAAGLEAVLDWEFAHFGSPEEDVAWIAVRDWRFGRLDLAVGGLCERPRFWRAYEAAAGRRLDAEAVHWWEVMGNARWAAGAVHQAERVLAGAERDVEFVAIGRRAAEMEWEALRLVRRGPQRADG